MTTLFDATRPVKSARPARRFGAGLLAFAPVYPVDYSASDAAWWAAESARLERARDAGNARLERRAAEAAALDCLGRGLIPPDTAETIARTSIVGHTA